MRYLVGWREGERLKEDQIRNFVEYFVHHKYKSKMFTPYPSDPSPLLFLVGRSLTGSVLSLRLDRKR